MRLIGDHGKALALCGGELAHLVQRKRKRLDGADHDLFATGQGFGQLFAFAGTVPTDDRHHALGALKGHDGFAQLAVQHSAIGNHDDRVKDLFLIRVVQVSQKVCRPGNRIRFAGTGRVLDQVFGASAFRQNGRDNFASDHELVVARKNPARQLLLVIFDRHDVTSEDLQPAVALPDLFPQVIRGNALFDRIARTAILPLIECQEHGVQTLEAGGHGRFAVADGKMHQRTPWKAQERLCGVLSRHSRQSVSLVLGNRVCEALGVMALELDRGHRDAVDEQHQINVVAVVLGIPNLTHHPQAIGDVPGLQIGIHGQGGLELAHAQGFAQAHHVKALAQHVHQALTVQCLAHAFTQDLLCIDAMAGVDDVPGLGLCGLNPGCYVFWEQCQCTVISRVGIYFVNPALMSQAVTDFIFQLDFFVHAHAASAISCSSLAT